MFVGREKELKQLEDWYDTLGFQMPVLYGRRRVGKTRLINEFIKDKPAIYFTAIKDDGTTNLANLSQSIAAFDQKKEGSRNNTFFPSSPSPVYADFQDAFRAIAQRAKSERVIFVIDEFPYLAESDDSIPSLLQMIIDAEFKEGNLFLILCGSSMSFMEEQVLGYQSPLYGRRTGQLKIEPLDFFEARLFFPHVDIETALAFYGMVGGIPLYLEQIRPHDSILDNISELFCNPSSILFEEPQNLLKQEVREAARYNAIIGAIADGKTKNAEIASTVGIPTGALNPYLQKLQQLCIVQKKSPITYDSKKKSIYQLSDNLFRFWYRFIPKNISFIEGGLVLPAAKSIESSLPEYLGLVFENVCTQWIWKQVLEENMPPIFDRLGSWWGNDPRVKSEAEIDIVGMLGERATLFAECKWRNSPLDIEVLNALKNRSELIPFSSDKVPLYYLFSKSGFTKACIEESKSSTTIRLVDAHEMTG